MNGSSPISVDFSGALASGIDGLFYILVLVFVIHAIALSYHWTNYGNSKTTSLAALATYLMGAAVLFGVMVSAMYAL